MDSNGFFWSSEPPSGSKRPSPMPASEDREIKKSRTQSHDDGADCIMLDNDLDDNILIDDSPFNIYENASFPSPDPYYHGDQFGDGFESEPDNINNDALANMPIDPVETEQQIPSNTPIQCATQSGQTLSRESQAEELLSQTPAVSPLPESMELDNNYDTCFGVILATPRSSFALKTDAHSVPVNMKSSGDILILYNQNHHAYAGILNHSKLADALRRLHLRTDATLVISEVKEKRKKGKSKMKKHASAEGAREYSLRIIVYGLSHNKETVSKLLSDAGCFLHHPYATEIIPEVLYDNPHYLLRPDAKMPKLECSPLDIADDNHVQAGLGGEINKSHFLRIFETSGADGEMVKVVNTSPSPRLCSLLMRHQFIALAMMHEKESGYVEEPMFPSLWRKRATQNSETVYYQHTVTESLERRPIPTMGGILADDMGLGKTLSVLALICSSLDLDSIKDQNRKTEHQGTLIIAPKSTIHGWMAQASEHIHEGQIRIKIYHGFGRASLASQFQDTDVIITTYETLRSEWEIQEGTRPLFSWKWLRVILDEAHHIRNRSSKIFRSVCDLVACYRWCLTGTPIHNSLDNYGALLSFIRVFPFVQKSNFMSYVVRPVDEKHMLGVERLQRLIRATCLRRTKQKTLDLPRRHEIIQEVHLHQDDQVLYDFYKKICAEKAAGQEKRSGEGLSSKDKEYNILSLILCLQRICDHGKQLLPGIIEGKRESASASFSDLEQQQQYCCACGDRIDDSFSGMGEQDSLCANCTIPDESSLDMNIRNNLFSEEDIGYQSASSESSDSANTHCRPSAKVLALLENLRQEQTQPSTGLRKSIVFSAWVKMLDLVEQTFRKKHIRYERIDGRTSLDGRRRALQVFNNNPECTVMLASIGSSAEGVNLTAASIVHLLEPNWNPMVEAQAIDRVHRIGQTQEVTVIRYIVPNSVEIYVRDVQEEKMRIINQTMNMSDVTEAYLESRRWERMKQMLA